MPRRWPIALVVAVVAAEGAVLLLRPRSGVIEPAPVRTQDYFTSAQIERARDFRRPQLALFAASLGLQAGLLVVLVRRPPGRLRRVGSRRPVLGGAAAGAALSLALTAVTLPIDAIAHERARHVGLATQGWVDWGGDIARSAGVGVVLAAGGGAIAVGLMRRVRRWWIPGAGVVVVLGAAFLYAGPVLLDPLFNRFTALPAGRTRSDVLALARRAGVDVGQVYEIDASRRTTGVNAYVTGLGHSKRVVIYDNLLKRFSRDEVRLVVAHELGHVHDSDVPRGLLYLALVAPFGTWAVYVLTRRWSPAPAGPATLPALLLALAVVSTPMTWASNQLSRRVEARADSFALELTGETRPFIGFEQRIATDNVSDPDPPGWLTFLLGTHPSSVQRIGAAVAYERSLARFRGEAEGRP